VWLVETVVDSNSSSKVPTVRGDVSVIVMEEPPSAPSRTAGIATTTPSLEVMGRSLSLLFTSFETK
jgi:hypothetical protein